MSNFNFEKVEYLVEMLESYGLDYWAAGNALHDNFTVLIYPKGDKSYGLDYKDYVFLEFTIKDNYPRDCILETVYNITVDSKDPHALLQHCVKLNEYTTDYKYDPSKIAEYSKMVKRLDQFSDIYQVLNETDAKIKDLKKHNDVAAVPLSEFYENKRTTIDTNIKEIVGVSENKNNSNEVVNNEVTKTINDVKKDFFSTLTLLFMVAIVSISFFTLGWGTLVFTLPFLVTFYRELRKDGYSFSNLLNKNNKDNDEVDQNDNTQDGFKCEFKPKKKLATLENDERFEKITNLSDKYYHFSSEDQLKYVTCIEQLVFALETYENNISYVKNDKRDEILIDIIYNVNSVMDNIENNLNKQNNDELAVINSFNKDYDCLEK